MRHLNIHSRIFFYDRGSYRYMTGIILGLAFSMAVILSTIGIMDGFDLELKKALKKSNGDLSFYSRSGFFFPPDEPFLAELEQLGIKKVTPLIRTKGFAIANEQTKGVLIQGVQQDSFKDITGIELDLSDGVAIGVDLAKSVGVKIGDYIVLAFANGNDQVGSLPALHRLKVEQFIDHGIYEKDARFVYLPLVTLQENMSLENRINMMFGKVIPSDKVVDQKDIDLISDIKNMFLLQRRSEYKMNTFWDEQSHLLDAVKVEKVMIGIILQVVVLVSIFNVLAFIIYINEKQSKSIFLLRALGAPGISISRIWYAFLCVGWILSSIVAVGFVQLFNYLLTNISIFQLPKNVYTLGHLQLKLGMYEYLTVFGLTGIWLFLATYIVLRKNKRLSLLEGLRREFV